MKGEKTKLTLQCTNNVDSCQTMVIHLSESFGGDVYIAININTSYIFVVVRREFDV